MTNLPVAKAASLSSVRLGNDLRQCAEKMFDESQLSDLGLSLDGMCETIDMNAPEVDGAVCLMLIMAEAGRRLQSNG